MGGKHVELSVIVPCWNEEGNVELLTERTLKIFQQLAIEGELIFVIVVIKSFSYRLPFNLPQTVKIILVSIHHELFRKKS